VPRHHQAAIPAGLKSTAGIDPQRLRHHNKMNTLNPSSRPAGRQTLALIGWLALCFAASGTAVFVSIGGWYSSLNKPSWNPPPWIFGPVWSLLYIMMAVAAWLVWREGGWKRHGRTLGLFFLQWLLNAVWTPIFFGMHRSGLAFAEIIMLWIVLAATLRLFWRVSKLAGVLLVPYVVWVSFAAALNFAIWRLNI
jgi:tryptophan-rich sensory protein